MSRPVLDSELSTYSSEEKEKLKRLVKQLSDSHEYVIVSHGSFSPSKYRYLRQESFKYLSLLSDIEFDDEEVNLYNKGFSILVKDSLTSAIESGNYTTQERSKMYTLRDIPSRAGRYSFLGDLKINVETGSGLVSNVQYIMTDVPERKPYIDDETIKKIEGSSDFMPEVLSDQILQLTSPMVSSPPMGVVTVTADWPTESGDYVRKQYRYQHTSEGFQRKNDTLIPITDPAVFVNHLIQVNKLKNIKVNIRSQKKSYKEVLS